jgi:phosphoglycerol transferase MdoB-like AlkP superfamily enzyme
MNDGDQQKSPTYAQKRAASTAQGTNGYQENTQWIPLWTKARKRSKTKLCPIQFKMKGTAAKMTKFIPRSLRFVITLTALHFILFVLFRFVFFLNFQDTTRGASVEDLLFASYLGIKFDLRLACLIALPALLLAWVPGFRLKTKSKEGFNFSRLFWSWLYTIVFAAILFLYAGDFANFGYMETRLNASLLEFVENPFISARMLWETYPVIWISLGFLAFLALYRFLFFRVAFEPTFRSEVSKGFLKKFGPSVLVVLLFLGGIYGKWSYYPLRWSEAFFSRDAFVSALALNPVLYLSDSFEAAQEKYNLEKVEKHYDHISKVLNVDQPNRKNLSFQRRYINPESELTQKLKEREANVVIILLESFGAYKTGLFGNPFKPTPNFDRIANEGKLYTRFHVASEGTARSIFSVITGLPDTNSKSTSSRNPLVIDQHTVVNAFKNHQKLYLLGGSANWGNIRGVLSHNIDGIEIFEEGDYQSPRSDVWGISDLHLLKEANEIFRARHKKEKPFFAMVQTAGNHRPYTIPDDNEGFKPLEGIDEELIKKHGFKSLEELQSFHFMDHSLGRFFERAKEEDYFEDTVFVLFADHGLPSRADHFPKAEVELELTRFHSPLVFYSPALVEPERINRVASALDILPTLAAYTGQSFLNTSLGRNLLAPEVKENPYALVFTSFKNPPEYGLVRQNYYVRTELDGKAHFYHLRGEKAGQKMVDLNQRIRQKEENLLRGLRQTGLYMLHHNPRLPHPNGAKGGSGRISQK